MASTVVGLFERRSDAEAALQELITSGYSESDIDLKGDRTYGEGDALSGLRSELEGHGVPEGDARLFAEGVRSGDAIEIAHTSDDKAELAREIMNRHGAIDIHDAFSYRSSALTDVGAAGAGLAAAATTAATTANVAPATAATAGETVIPVVEEELAVDKREIQRGGARIHTRVTERPVSEQVTLHEEHVTVQRNVVDRPVSSADAAFREGDITLTETAEVPVVAKEAHVVEEVVVGKTATDRVETVTDTVRRTDVEVEELPGTTTTSGTTKTGL